MDQPVDVALYHPALRWAAAVLRGLAALTVVAVALLAASDIATGDLVMPPGRAIRALVAWALLPEAAARALHLLARATLTLEGGSWVLTTRWRRHEVPPSAVAAARPWRIPLPVPGLTLVTRSGRRFGIGTAEPARLVESLGGRSSRLASWAEAKSAARPSWRRLALKFGLFPLAPALVLFRLHEVIAYGGPLGEYYLLGGRAWATTLVTTVAATVAQLVLYAAVWRLAGELVAIGGAAVAPGRTRPLRRVIGWALAIAYYVGVPAFIGLRLLA